MPIHVAITRRVRAGREAEFQHALREFLQSSFAHEGVWGASMLVPLPDSATREYGILRTFASEAERDAFYCSPAFAAWEQRARTLTEGEPAYRQMHGLEAWFRNSSPPPRWKMAAATFAGVFPLALILTWLVNPFIGAWPLLLRSAAFNLLMVAGLTWGIMPFLTRQLRGWLSTPPSTRPNPS